MTIDGVGVRQVLNSSGRPTLEIEIRTGQIVAREAAPCGTTVGQWDPGRSDGQPTHELVQRLNRALVGRAVADQSQIDEVLISEFGENGRSNATDITTAASLAVLRASAKSSRVPIWHRVADLGGFQPSVPGLVLNFINGGPHANSSLRLTECLLVLPAELVNSDLVASVSAVFLRLGERLISSYGPESGHVGLEGGYTPDVASPETVLTLLSECAAELGDNAGIGLDVAANSWELPEGYLGPQGEVMSGTGLRQMYLSWARQFSRLCYLEDPFADDDLAGWRELLKSELSAQIVADDVLSSSISRLDELVAAESMPGTAILKVDQAGTVSDFISCRGRLGARRVVVSQRSQETDSNILAHLAVGVGANYMKAGAPARERIVKYNELFRLAEKPLWES